MEFASISDRGLRRKNNEDTCFAADSGIFIVADGMGGHQSGEVASQMATDFIKRHLTDTYDQLVKRPRTTLVEAVKQANRIVRASAIQNPELQNMGTTVVVGFLRDHVLHCVNVGDSRAYVIRPPRTIRQLTRDHSYVQELVERGEIDATEARTHPMRNIITQNLGGGSADLHADYRRALLKEGDYVLLCTDGLYESVPDELILAELTKASNLAQACERLVSNANSMGGEDNVTIVIVRDWDNTRKGM
jgi:serine/threonine protein phosphatase PrpC